MSDLTLELIQGQPKAADTARYNSEQLEQRSLYRRAVEAVIWGMPAVNFDLMLQAFIKAGGGPNQVPYWSRLLDWRNQTLTPNPDTIYFNPFIDTKDGPMVLEIPPADGGSITGSIDTCWQNALEDVGPAGLDQGAGGKYLILPPGHEGELPSGYIPVPSDNYQGFVILRSNVKSGSDADVATAVAYGKRIRLYPFSQAANPPETKFFDLAGVMFDSTIRYDHSFFASLARMIDHEPWLDRDRAMIDPLKSLGIAKGKPFAPDDPTRKFLDAAAREAHGWIDMQYEHVFEGRFFPDRRWAVPANPEVVKALSSSFAEPESYPTDGRGVAFSMAYFSAKHLGAGQFYLMAIADREGQAFDGAATYRLRVPPDAPVDLYWSATAYDRETHALIREVSHSSRASTTPEIESNADGSVDVWFSPMAPAGKAANWVPTIAGRGFEVLVRLYGVRKSFFDKSWVLPDVERIG